MEEVYKQWVNLKKLIFHRFTYSLANENKNLLQIFKDGENWPDGSIHD